jgi:hypothetical protein
MKKIYFIITLIAITVLLATHCENENCHKAIAFDNKSSRDVYVFFSGHGIHGVPDSSFSLRSLNFSKDLIKSNKKSPRAIANGDCLEMWIKDRSGPLNVFVLDVEVFETVPRDTIIKYRMVTTIRPTIEEMERSNWTITFTGE